MWWYVNRVEREGVELRVAGQTHRVVSSADRATLERLASKVEERMHHLVGRDRSVGPDTLFLAAIALAHDLEQAEARMSQVEARSREMLQSLLQRVDAALDSVDENGLPLEPVSIAAAPRASGSSDAGTPDPAPR